MIVEHLLPICLVGDETRTCTATACRNYGFASRNAASWHQICDRIVVVLIILVLHVCVYRSNCELILSFQQHRAGWNAMTGVFYGCSAISRSFLYTT